MQGPTFFQAKDECEAHTELVSEVRTLCDLVRENTTNVNWMIRLGKWAVGLTGAIAILAISFGAFTIKDIRALEKQVFRNTTLVNMLCSKVLDKHFDGEGKD